MNAFVIDFLHTNAGGAVHVFDLAARRRVATLPTRYAPEIAVGPDGRLLVADFDPENCSEVSELRSYHGGTFALERSIAVGPRTRYNVGPGAATMRVTPDGKSALVLLVETVASDLAHHSIGVVDLARGRLRAEALSLPEHVFTFGFIGRGPRSWVLVQGRELSGLGWGDPMRGADLEGFFQSIDLRGRAHLNAIAAVAAEPGGRRVWLASREGRLVTADLVKRRVDRAPALALPDDLKVPMQQLAVGRDRLYLGLGGDRSAWAGRADRIAVFDLASLRHLYDVALTAPSYWMELSSDGRTLVVLSELRRTLTLHDAADGKPLGAPLGEVAASPVAFTLGPARLR